MNIVLVQGVWGCGTSIRRCLAALAVGYSAGDKRASRQVAGEYSVGDKAGERAEIALGYSAGDKRASGQIAVGYSAGDKRASGQVAGEYSATDKNARAGGDRPRLLVDRQTDHKLRSRRPLGGPTSRSPSGRTVVA